MIVRAVVSGECAAAVFGEECMVGRLSGLWGWMVSAGGAGFDNSYNALL